MSDPPLVPSPDQGRDLLRRELLDPDYHQDDVMGRLIDWLRRRVLDVLDAASSAPPLSAFAAMAVGLLLVLALIWLTTRARSAPQQRPGGGAILPDASVTAREWRERAEQALAERTPLGRAGRRLPCPGGPPGRARPAGRPRPATTAHEVTQALRSAYPDRAAEMSEGARLFDLVLYGDRSATRDQAELVLALDDELAQAR